MSSLLERLKALPKIGKLSYAGNSFTVQSLVTQAEKIRQEQPQLAQQAIALHFTNLADFITAIIAFDGYCTAIYLCPANESLPGADLISWPLENAQNEQSAIKASCGSETQTATAWYLATSGTTGQPKWYAHTLSALTASSKFSEKLQALRWALFYQPFRYAGLQVVLQALLSSADLVDATGLEPLAQVNACKEAKVTAISATPSLWRQLLMTGQLADLPLRHITLGGEIADQSVLDNLKRLFPKAKIRHIYASTESGVGLIVADGLAGFPVKWLDDPSLPVCLTISDKQHLLVKPQFALDQKLIAQTDEQGFLDTQDSVQIKGHRVLFLGRASGIINVGGNKVHPEKVEQVLLQCTEISQAKVYGKKNALMGELVVADVAIKPNADQQQVQRELMLLSKNQLQRFEIPTKINCVAKISHDPSGKLNRK